MLYFSYLSHKTYTTLGTLLRRMGNRKRNRNVNKFAQRKRDKKEQEKNPQAKLEGDTRKHYEDIVRENPTFEEYYKGQKVCPEEEWPAFMKALKENLPTAFRITGSKCEADALMNIVKSEYFSELLNVKLKTEGEEEEEIKPMNLPWYPNGLAWQLRLSRTDIRRSEPLYKLHNFLVAETAAGGVSRQEAVSMIPPVVLDVQPHHKVLDMCAAPGSKTAQLIEFLHADEDKMPTGFVMANDVDNSRCYMLVHQAKRLNSPCIVITNHDSAVMPSIQITDPKNPESTVPLKFDRILCDVPCSGDATLRKNPDIWLKWSTGNGNNLHGIQYRVLKRGCELLAAGGRLVYSTCSFNPVENEAVIHRMLAEAGGSIALVDVRASLTGLKSHPGMTHWRPASKDMVFYDKFEDVPEKWQTVVRPQMFPPQPEDLDKFHLDRCIRILPHHQDTGGFFVAVLEKSSPLPWEKDRETEQPQERERKEEKPPAKRRRMGGYREDPFVFFKGDEEDVFPSIKEFYDLSAEFDSKCLLTRCHVGKKKNIYLVSPIVRDVVRRNEDSIKIINTGVKTFVRCDNKNMTCAFRLSQEGLASVAPFIGPGRRVRILKEDLVLVLQNDNPSKPPDLKLFSEHAQAQLKDLSTGSCILQYLDPECAGSLRLTLVGWRGVHSLRAYTAAPDTVHYLRLLGADFTRYDVNKFKKASDVPEGDADATETSEATEVTAATEEAPSETGEANGSDKL